jgi:hypothetical protein
VWVETVPQFLSIAVTDRPLVLALDGRLGGDRGGTKEGDGAGVRDLRFTQRPC